MGIFVVDCEWFGNWFVLLLGFGMVLFWFVSVVVVGRNVFSWVLGVGIGNFEWNWLYVG